MKQTIYLKVWILFLNGISLVLLAPIFKLLKIYIQMYQINFITEMWPSGVSLYVFLRNIRVTLCFQVEQRSTKMKYNDSQAGSLAAKMGNFQSHVCNRMDLTSSIACVLLLQTEINLMNTYLIHDFSII